MAERKRPRLWGPKVEGPNLRYDTDTIPGQPRYPDELPPSDEGSFDGDYDAEHLMISTPSNIQGTVDTISEGTVSVPHSESQMISDAVADQHAINREIERMERSVVPGALDTLWARRMRVHRFHIQPVQAQRLLQVNRARRYFQIMVDLLDTGAAATTIALSDQPINAAGLLVPDNTFAVTGLTGQALTYGPFFHQGELWGLTVTNAVASLSVIEYFGA